MSPRSVRCILGPLLVTLAVCLGVPATSQATGIGIDSDFIGMGWDLLETTQFTLQGVPGVPGLSGTRFFGAPLGSFDFGMGPVATFGTDTIVRRPVDVRDGQTIAIEMLARRMISEDGSLFFTLQSERGGPASTGTFTILIGPEPGPPTPGDPQPQHGTFTWTVSMSFDIRSGSFSGPIMFSGVMPLMATGIPWSHFPPAGAVLIPGVNFMLVGGSQVNDFWPVGTFAGLQSATVPEPGTIALLAAGVAGIGVRARRRARK